jgi:hypothetical protein
MTEKKTVRVLIKKDIDALCISIDNADINFEGSQLSFNKNFDVSFEDSLNTSLTGHLLVSFDSTDFSHRKINLAEENVKFSIEFNNCKVRNTYPTGVIDFKGISLAFKNCTPDTTLFKFSYKNSGNATFDTTLEFMESGYFKFDRSFIVTIQNALVKFSQGLSIDNLDNSKGTFQFSPDSRLEIYSGNFRKILTTGVNFSISIASDCNINYLSIADKFKFTNLFTSTQAAIVSGSDHLNLKLIKSISNLVINKIRLENFICDTCDFSNTTIAFENDSSINFKTFTSIATVWNPLLITYHNYNVKKKTIGANIPAAREFFSEMKTFFTNKGNTITAGEFHSVEMKSHLDLLRESKLSIRVFSERINLRMSYFSSDFGQNWHFPFFLYLLCSLIFYTIFLWANNFSPLLDFLNYLPLYFKILSPIEIVKSDFSDIVYNCSKHAFRYELAWLVWKIIAAYLIYQIVIASRKYVRKF